MANKVLVGMSGGVDSSVCAALLQQQGYEVTGMTLHLWKEATCGGQQDVEDARRVCEHLGIPHIVMDEQDNFYRDVVQDFIQCYEEGRTPNPCVRCNRSIKFGVMLDHALEMGFDYVATGHYALVEQDADGHYQLLCSPHDAKDQSYVLYSLTQHQLSHTLLPLGHYPKEEIRRMAQEFGLPVAHKSESQDICFIPDGDYAAFIQRQTGKCYPKGFFLDTDGNRIGTHQGIIHYTVGQRKGLGAFGRPMFVQRLHPEDNTITLAEKGQEYQSTLVCRDLNWISSPALTGPVQCEGKVRYKARRAACTVTPLGDGRAEVVFEEPQRAVTPGQSVVFYDGPKVLGGGIIE